MSVNAWLHELAEAAAEEAGIPEGSVEQIRDAFDEDYWASDPAYLEAIRDLRKAPGREGHQTGLIRGKPALRVKTPIEKSI